MAKIYYPTKHAWAAAKAAELREHINVARYTSTAGRTRATSRRYDAIHSLEQELLKFERLAERYAESGQ